MSPNEPSFLSFLQFAFTFVVLWCLFLGAMSMISGWRKLESIYPKQPTNRANWRYMCSGKLGGFFFNDSYQNCLNIGRDDHFLHLKPLLPFALFHPQISIPLNEIRRDGSVMLGRKRLRLTRSDIPLTNSGLLADWIVPGD